MPDGSDNKMRQPPQGKQDKIAIFWSADRGEGEWPSTTKHYFLASKCHWFKKTWTA